ncbi:uncharacterized protein MONBRDRAFT_37864 [Monosiga brevicollis MX1]|uniref:PXA domain-containing protein n=1 Tax=Monosiga brevicollis TaxID=81824 RepID=A9V4B5_MONBE|nr:uncharacterized protein MONBRDRAFT_37864 [Monosiga brevicollis MX1]EDQ87681.1 predicted protein [Monosiga brevicollis MX1]|eukprot:XP_001747601.1 hypothetical protein [Monosiga brevicollis MX1]
MTAGGALSLAVLVGALAWYGLEQDVLVYAGLSLVSGALLTIGLRHLGGTSLAETLVVALVARITHTWRSTDTARRPILVHDLERSATWRAIERLVIRFFERDRASLIERVVNILGQHIERFIKAKEATHDSSIMVCLLIVQVFKPVLHDLRYEAELEDKDVLTHVLAIVASTCIVLPTIDAFIDPAWTIAYCVTLLDAAGGGPATPSPPGSAAHATAKMRNVDQPVRLDDEDLESDAQSDASSTSDLDFEEASLRSGESFASALSGMPQTNSNQAHHFCVAVESYERLEAVINCGLGDSPLLCDFLNADSHTYSDAQRLRKRSIMRSAASMGFQQASCFQIALQSSLWPDPPWKLKRQPYFSHTFNNSLPIPEPPLESLKAQRKTAVNLVLSMCPAWILVMLGHGGRDSVMLVLESISTDSVITQHLFSRLMDELLVWLL